VVPDGCIVIGAGEQGSRTLASAARQPLRIAELYDMIHPGEGDTSTVRSVFIVDPDDKLRLTLTYPKSVGRNFDEIVRVIDALQATDKDPIATPADWQPGDRVIVSLSMSTEDAERTFENVEEFKPYLRYADAPK
jgi:thioredoxin-dependent peroxiredoxin